MTRETYGVRTVNRLSLFLFLCQSIGIFASTFLLLGMYRPLDFDIVTGFHIAFVVLFPIAPITLSFLLWKEQKPSLALAIGWVLSSLLFAFGLHTEWIDHFNEQSAIGYQVGIISFALPAVIYAATVLIHSAATTRKYGMQTESVYRGD